MARRFLVLVFLATCAATACAPRSYRAGTLEASLSPSAIRKLGCLDVGFALDEKEHAGKLRLLLRTYVGNRCGRSAPMFDLTKLVVEHRARDASQPLRLFDPRGEIEPRHVEVFAHGDVAVWLDPWIASDSATRVCVDASRTATAPDARADGPICFLRDEEGKWQPDTAL